MVDGNHKWYNYVEKGLAFVEFSPDNKKILITKKKENIYIFSINGTQIGTFSLPEPYNEYEIVTIDWWCDYRRYNKNKNEINSKEAKNNNKEKERSTENTEI